MALIIRQAQQDTKAAALGVDAAWLVVTEDDTDGTLSAWSSAPVDPGLTVPVDVPISDPGVPAAVRDSAKNISSTTAGQRVMDTYKRGVAQTNAGDIPGWASWTEAQAVTWIDANVTDLASAKQALTAMARLLVALRNEAWPGLEG